VKFVRALLGGALVAAAAVTFQVATAPSAPVQASALCVNCWDIIQP
jgi:hypothetical protein